ncbi:rhomboid family intramembrane serine protease [Tundrisphaera sp. TA3]|uniref:rhomboid family intramembrane serine protease n=1 Tax=Tundrisphaera sp. TA3 TaxID=3435775 RepID=UPI003EBA0228
MGISDREYYRDKTRGGGWLSGEAPACKAIIMANVALFVGQQLIPPLTSWFEATSHGIFQEYRIWELVTATFIHDKDNPLHILFNMMFLWMVGREMERFYGSRDFAAMYLTAAAFSTFCWAVVDAFGPRHGMMLGASGAVMAVMVLYTLYYPRREVIFLIFPVEMRLLLMVFLGYNVLQLLVRSDEPVAFASHLGGAAYGYLFKVGNLRISRLDPFFSRKPRLRIVSAETREPTPTRATSGPTWTSNISSAVTKPAPSLLIPEEMFDEKLDEILVKIAQQGRNTLSEDENRVLEEASRRARNRRGERI